MDELLDTHEVCPVDLEAAVAASTLPMPGSDLVVEVSEGSGEVPMDASASDAFEEGYSAVDWYNAVQVTCALPVEGGEVATELLAARRPQASAVGMIIPYLSRDLGLTNDELEGVVDRFEATDAGELVDLGAQGSVAVARIEVAGAESAALYVSAADVDTTSPAEVRAITEELLDRL